MLELEPPVLRPLCTLLIELGVVRSLGTGRLGQRRIIPIAGGSVVGPRLNGKILPGGADWLTVSHEGVALLDARFTLETNDGALIEVVDQGFRHAPEDIMKAMASGEAVDPKQYYMRSSLRLETGDPRYSFVNRMIFVSTGAKTPSGVQINIFSVE